MGMVLENQIGGMDDCLCFELGKLMLKFNRIELLMPRRVVVFFIQQTSE